MRPAAPTLHAHITGSVVAVDGANAQITILDPDGHSITAGTDLTGAIPAAGHVITASLRQDLKTGQLTIPDLETADAKIGRLRQALQTAVDTQSAENQRNLEQRLRASITGHMTTLQEALNRVQDTFRNFVFAPTLQRLGREYDDVLSAVGLGTQITGIIEIVDADDGTVFVSPMEGPEVQVNLTGETEIRVFGSIGRAQNLRIGHQVTSVYDPSSNEAKSLEVFFPSLRQELIKGQLAHMLDTQLEGVIVDTGPSSVSVRLDSDLMVQLEITPDTRIKTEEAPAVLGALGSVVPVKVTYDPATLNAIAIEQAAQRQGDAFVSGVITSFIPKVEPGIVIPGNADSGNLLISTVDGDPITLSITGNTVIEVDGERMTVFAVKVGDLIRPTSRYNTSTREVQRLVLTSASVQGSIRGKLTAPSGRNYLTIATDDLKFVTLAVSDSTSIIMSDEEASFEALQIEERLLSGLHHPLTLRASHLTVGPPKTIGISGSVANVDTHRGIVTITPEVGGPVVLLVPAKPGIVLVGGAPSSVESISRGDLVDLALYAPDTKIVVRISVRPQ